MRVKKRNLLSEGQLTELHREVADSDGRKSYEVVIIGNGPSAIILSFFLSGNWPHYNGLPLDDPVLRERLAFCSQKESLVQEDLQWLSEGLYDSRTSNPVSILFDHLYHPNADLLTNDKSVVEWVYHPENEVRHLVVGLGPAGGSWHKMSYSQLTVSLAHWLEFPGMPFASWFRKNKEKISNLPEMRRFPGVHIERTNARYLGMYYSDYVEEMGLSRNFLNNIQINAVSRINNGVNRFKVEGVQYLRADQHGEAFTVLADNVVLASGAFREPRLLGIPGEDHYFVHHTLPDLDGFQSCPVLVVGCGLVALDAVLALMEKRIAVIHVFRRDVKDPQLIINQLSSAYSDYVHLKSFMINKQSNKYYTPLARHNLVKVLPNKEVVIEHVHKKTTLQFHVSRVIIQIGFLPDLSFLKDMDNLLEDPTQEFSIKGNPIDVNMYTYESTQYNGLYALGPLVGDNFVRFISGGALAITHGLFADSRADHANDEYEEPFSARSSAAHV